MGDDQLDARSAELVVAILADFECAPFGDAEAVGAKMAHGTGVFSKDGGY